MSEKGKRGVWYWITLLNPTMYFLAKLVGGQAELDAELAMNDLGLGLVVAVVIGVGIFLVLSVIRML